MESFMYCANDCKCNAVELDVFVIKDGTLVVFHGCDGNANIPGSLQGYCLPDNQADLVLTEDGGSYRSIMDLTYEETQQLSFNPDFEEFVCPKECIVHAKIPKLHDVLLQLSKTDLQEVKIELKGPGTVEPVLSLVEQLNLQQLCSYSSFDHTQLQELRALRPNNEVYRTGALFNAPICDDDYIHRAATCGATAIHLRYDDCTIDRIHTIHENNLVSMAWCRGPMGMASDALYRFNDIGGDIVDATNKESDRHLTLIENEACYRTLLDTGVQQICCNRPDLLMKILSDR
jgi:glycerophosphoryl diester phosphodiesterase